MLAINLIIKLNLYSQIEIHIFKKNKIIVLKINKFLEQKDGEQSKKCHLNLILLMTHQSMNLFKMSKSCRGLRKILLKSLII